MRADPLIFSPLQRSLMPSVGNELAELRLHIEQFKNSLRTLMRLIPFDIISKANPSSATNQTNSTNASSIPPTNTPGNGPAFTTGNPTLLTSSQFAQILQSETSKQLLESFNQMVTSVQPNGGALRPLIQLVRTMPSLLEPMNSLFNAIRQQQPNSQVLQQTVNFMENIAQEVYQRTQSMPAGLRHFGAQQGKLFLQHSQNIILAQSGMPAHSRADSAQIIRFLNFAIQERPGTFENELFALPVLQRAGVDISTYQRLANSSEPIRLALLVIEASKISGQASSLSQQAANTQGGSVLVNMLQEMKAALLDKDPTRALQIVVGKWEQQLKPPLPQSTNSSGTISLAQATAQIQRGGNHALLVQALSQKSGLLPDSAWQIETGLTNVNNPTLMTSGQLAIQAGLMATATCPPGAHRLKLRVQGDTDDESIIEFLLSIVTPFEEESDYEEEEKQKRKSPAKDYADISQMTQSIPLTGQVDMQLSSPFILTQPYNENSVVPAPLQVSFHFLMDFTEPQTRMSREQFLTLTQSTEAANLRESVLELAENGPAGIDKYVKNLQVLFDKLKKYSPQFEKSFEQAKRYLRDEVVLYMLGKKSNIQSQHIKILEGSSRGDLIASICATSASTLTLAGHTSDALIHFSDAARIADSQPYFMGKLEGFLETLRWKLSGHGEAKKVNTDSDNHESPEWRPGFPELPPGPSGYQVQSYRLAAQFANAVRSHSY